MPVTGTPVDTDSIIGTPVAHSAVVGTPVDLDPVVPTLSPVTTTLYDVPVPPKRRAVAAVSSTCTTLRAQILDDNGDPVDLTDYTADRYTVNLAVGEVIGCDPSLASTTLGEFDHPSDAGWVRAVLPASVATRPGIYLASLSISDDTAFPRCTVADEVVTAVTRGSTALAISTLRPDASTYDYLFPADAAPLVGVGAALTLRQQLVQNVCLAQSNTLYLTVEKGLMGVGQTAAPGPPGLAEVRLHLRDYPEVNRLLDNYEFDAAEIAQASARCVDYFNEVPPDIGQRYDSTTFPFRYYWLEGTVFHLLMTAATWYDRNHLSYSAGGVQVDDLNRSETYLRHAQLRGKEWKDWVSKTKVRANMEAAFGSLGSTYGQRW